MNLPTITTPAEFVEFIRGLPANDDATAEIGFDMAQTHLAMALTKHPCGKACCIGGWLCLVLDRIDCLVGVVTSEFLQISEDAADRLCFPSLSDVPNRSAITPQQAARAIENVIATGDPDWPGVLEDRQ